MPAELCLDDSHVAGVVRECSVLEGLDHLTTAEPAEVATSLPRGAFRVLCGEGTEVLASIDPPLEVESLIVCVHKDVEAACLSYHALEIDNSFLPVAIGRKLEVRGDHRMW